MSYASAMAGVTVSLAVAGAQATGVSTDTLVAIENLEGSAFADTLTGNGGANQYVYGSMLDAGDVITDFKPGVDTLVLTRLLAAVGIASADPLASGHVTCTTSAAGAVIGIDTDGSAGAIKTKPLLQLKGVACGAVTASSYKF